MKIRKNATQKNVILSKEDYTNNELKDLFRLRLIFFFNEQMNASYNIDELENDTVIRVFTENIEKLEIKLDNGFYRTVAKTFINGLELFVTL